MKNAGMAGAVALVGIGLITIGLGNFANTPQAIAAAPAVVVEAGPEEAVIVWYGTMKPRVDSSSTHFLILRAWSNGMVEGLKVRATNSTSCGDGVDCAGNWFVISSPDQGLNAAADINFDEVVDGQDLGVLLAAWGDAPRNPMPASDCPLGLLNP